MNTSGTTAAILLASGFSKRFGERDKLLFPFRGKPLARYALELAAALDLPGGTCYVVSSDAAAALAEDLGGIVVIKNSNAERGLRESVRLGVEAAGQADHYLFFHCDQPFLNGETVRLIVNERGPGLIVEPRSQDRPGNPCLFSRAFREELLSLRDGERPKIIKARHPDAIKSVVIQDPMILRDIDDQETLWDLEGSVYGRK